MPHERIGVFGGTFDPPHLGHTQLAQAAYQQLDLDRLLWVLTPIPPHKPERAIADLNHRLAMTQLIIAEQPRFELSRVEIDRPGPHFTLNTIRLLQAQFPSAHLILLIGGDSLRNLHSWHRPSDLVVACHEIGVMRRPNDSVDLSAIEMQIPGTQAKVRFVDAPLSDIASSEIRRRARKNQNINQFLSPTVYDYIQKNELYR